MGTLCIDFYHDDFIKWKHLLHYWPIVTRSFDVFFDLCLNKQLSKQWWGWWLRRHRAHYDVIVMYRKLHLHIRCHSLTVMLLKLFKSYETTRIDDITQPHKAQQHIAGLMQKRCNSSALAMELRLCVKPSACAYLWDIVCIELYSSLQLDAFCLSCFFSWYLGRRGTLRRPYYRANWAFVGLSLWVRYSLYGQDKMFGIRLLAIGFNADMIVSVQT